MFTAFVFTSLKLEWLFAFCSWTVLTSLDSFGCPGLRAGPALTVTVRGWEWVKHLWWPVSLDTGLLFNA